MILLFLWFMEIAVFLIRAMFVILWELTIWPFRLLGHFLFK